MFTPCPAHALAIFAVIRHLKRHAQAIICIPVQNANGLYDALVNGDYTYIAASSLREAAQYCIDDMASYSQNVIIL
ncbi:MAG: hypothetical protein PHQ22_10825 [Sulfuricurvum sp.]|nr:hypothetical protein [Sulfuricurvum sp.]